LEQAENVLGSKFNETVLAETVPHPFEDADDTGFHDSALDGDPISRYAEQPVDIREGIESAYTSMKRNLSSAAQTILAVPMEVFERSGTEACSTMFVLTRDSTYPSSRDLFVPSFEQCRLPF
jgi:autophagy-related protein 2